MAVTYTNSLVAEIEQENNAGITIALDEPVEGYSDTIVISADYDMYLELASAEDFIEALQRVIASAKKPAKDS